MPDNETEKKCVHDSEATRAAVRFVLEGGSPRPYIELMDRKAEAVFDAQMKSVRSANQTAGKS